MKVIVTGGAGFIGSHLVEKLVNDGHQVLVLDNLSTGKKKNLESVEGKYEFMNCTVGVDNFMSSEADVIFHLAALPRVMLSVEKPYETHTANVIGTLGALELAKKLKVKKFIYASSSSVYGDQEKLPLVESMKANPKNPYALHKYMGELYCRLYQEMYGISTWSMRFFNVYGSRMALKGEYKLVFGNWIESIRKKEKIKIFGDGNQSRDFTHVSDVVEALVFSMYQENVRLPVVLNVGSGKETTVNRLAELFGFPIEHIEERKFEEKRKVAGIKMIDLSLGWRPKIMIEEGVELLKKEYGLFGLGLIIASFLFGNKNDY